MASIVLGNLIIENPVNTIADLKAIDVSSHADGVICECIDTGMCVFITPSSQTADDIQWFNPNVATGGQWFLQSPNLALNASSLLSAENIADGTITDAEFECLDGVTSNIQQQINSFVGGSTYTGITLNVDTQLPTPSVNTFYTYYINSDLLNITLPDATLAPLNVPCITIKLSMYPTLISSCIVSGFTPLVSQQQFIENLNSYPLDGLMSITVQSDGVQWWIVL